MRTKKITTIGFLIQPTQILPLTSIGWPTVGWPSKSNRSRLGGSKESSAGHRIDDEDSDEINVDNSSCDTLSLVPFLIKLDWLSFAQRHGVTLKKKGGYYSQGKHYGMEKKLPVAETYLHYEGASLAEW